MGTSNFRYNTDNIFAVDDNCEFIYDDTKQNLISEFEFLDRANNHLNFFEKSEFDNNRNFGGFIYGSLYFDLYFLNLDIRINYELILRGGYYSGFNLDYEFNIEYNGSNYEDIDGLISDFMKYDDLNNGLKTIHKDNFKRLLESNTNRLKSNIETVYKMYSDEYICEGHFSDGTALYKAV